MDHTHFVYFGPAGHDNHYGYWWCSIARPGEATGEQFFGVTIMAADGIESLAGKMAGLHYYEDGETEILAAPIPDDAWNKARDILGPHTCKLLKQDEASALMKQLDERMAE